MSRIPAPKDLGSLITRLERRVDALARSTRLAYSSIDDAAVSVVDANGTLRGVIGQQYDGTTAVNIVNGPPPPTPSLPDVEGAIGGVYVMWDGTFTDALVAPMDFQRVEVHVAKTPGYIPTGLTLMATIESPQGGCATLPLRDYVPWYVVLVTRTTSGRAGTPSAVGSATPRQVAQPDLDPLLSIPTEIADGSITSVMIADSAITAPKVAASAIVAGKIAANAVTAGTIDANTVTAREVASNQINAAHIAAGSISALLVAGDIITTQPTPVNGTSRVVVDQAGIRLVSRSSAGVDTDRVNLNTGTGSGTFTGTIVGSDRKSVV